MGEPKERSAGECSKEEVQDKRKEDRERVVEYGMQESKETGEEAVQKMERSIK